MLKLKLPRSAHCLVARVSIASLERVKSTGIWELGTFGEDRRFWERLYAGDHVLLYSWHHSKFWLLGGVVVRKTLNLSIPKSQRPLRMALNVQGAAETLKLPLHPYQSRDDLFCMPGDFEELWEKCSPFEVFSQPLLDEYFFEYNGIKIRVASSLKDLEFIEKFAEDHSFGYRKAFLTLLAMKEDIRVGAVLIQPCSAIKFPHPSRKHIFGADHKSLANEALTISRIYTSKNYTHKFDLHEALLLGLFEIAPFMIEGTLRFIDAVSYDVHPLAEKLGFYQELPEKPSGTIYYWKPFAISAEYVSRRASTTKDVKDAIHHLMSARANIRFYIVFARRQHLSRAKSLSAWALEESKENNGLWKTIRESNIIFFLCDRQFIEGYGIASTIRRDNETTPYPLRIDFKHLEISDNSIDLTSEPFAGNIKLPSHGGIFAINNIVGSQLQSVIDLRYSETKMWVTPNAFLLPGTQFQIIPRQIFVIQAWSLITTVLPTLRKILEEANYTVTHADDRQGQVIFADIWTLMNEAEIVLVDFTEKRPNVYLEYGMALVLGKPIVAITKNLEDRPSDTPQLKVITYEDSMNGISALKIRLLNALKERSNSSIRN